MEDLTELAGGGRTLVHRRGDIVIRDTGPWTPAVHLLLRHLEQVGFDAAPRLVGSGFDASGRETLTFIEGEFIEPGPWTIDGAAALGLLLREWLNAKLHDDVVAELEGLPPASDRARHLAAIVDGYGLTTRQRRGFVDRIIEFAICDAAFEADDAQVTPELTTHPTALWAMAWRARSAAWIVRHRALLEAALVRAS